MIFKPPALKSGIISNFILVLLGKLPIHIHFIIYTFYMYNMYYIDRVYMINYNK